MMHIFVLILLIFTHSFAHEQVPPSSTSEELEEEDILDDDDLALVDYNAFLFSEDAEE